ncbi:unnamed protein product [Lathyrus oleraceus]
MARRVELVGIVIEKCDETFHVDRRERAQPGNGEKRVFAFVGSVLSLLLSSSHTSLTILSTFAYICTILSYYQSSWSVDWEERHFRSLFDLDRYKQSRLGP